MSEKDNQKVYFGDKKVSKDIKKDGVEEIFTKVSDNYDLMNDMMSVGMHRLWKRSFIDTANIQKDHVCLDLAAGTGDIAKLIAQKVSKKSIYLCDQNKEMIEKAKERSLNEGFLISVIFKFLLLKNNRTKMNNLITYSYLLVLETFQIRAKAC